VTGKQTRGGMCQSDFEKRLAAARALQVEAAGKLKEAEVSSQGSTYDFAWSYTDEPHKTR